MIRRQSSDQVGGVPLYKVSACWSSRVVNGGVNVDVDVCVSWGLKYGRPKSMTERQSC